jgi:hypothetical protein
VDRSLLPEDELRKLGDTLFTAVLGLCDGILYEVGEPQVKGLGRSQGRPELSEERTRIQRAGAAVVGTGADSRLLMPDGRLSAVTRSLGNRDWKREPTGISGLVSCIPEVKSIKLSWAEKHTFLLLNNRPQAEALSDQELVNIAGEFPSQPRAACGDMTTKALSKSPASAQVTSVGLWFLHGGPKGSAGEQELKEDGPPKKKAKTGSEIVDSARLRHIMLRYQEPAPGAPPKMQSDTKGNRSRTEAETVLREVMKELTKEMVDIKKKFKGKKPEEVALKSVKFSQLCKKHSDCPTSQKNGAMCGDLGWMSKELQTARGGNFRELVAPLRTGEYSDIVATADSLHLIQRIA